MADEFTPTTETELARFVADTVERDEPRRLHPVGGRTALFGVPKEGVVVSTAALADVVDHAVRDMTITVGAGIRIDELTARLAAEGQFLPVDVPQSQRATLGGVVATNTSGSRRFGFGTIRDHVIGVAAVDGTGRLFHAGGRVVKNVAGYDLCKLLVGSRGRYAILTGVTLRLRPRPASTVLLWFPATNGADVEAGLERLVTSGTRPVLLDVLCPGATETVVGLSGLDLPRSAATLVVGFSGTAEETDWQTETAIDELAPFLGDAPRVTTGEEATSLLDALVDYQTRSEDALVVKASATPSRTIALVQRATDLGFHVQAHAGNGVLYAHFDSADVHRAVRATAEFGELATASGGGIALHGCDPTWIPEFASVIPPSSGDTLAARLRTTFDPHGVLGVRG